MRRLLATLANVLVFAVVLALVLRAERHGFESLPGFVLEESGPPAIKAAHLRADQGRIDFLFLGSSRVYRQLNPAVFDARMAELGAPVHSYNLGLPGVRFYELLYLAESLLEEHPPALRWVVLELSDPRPPLEGANLLSRRSIEWHTAPVTALAVRDTLEASGSLAERWEDAGLHVKDFFLRSGNLGLGAPALVTRFWPMGVPEDVTQGGFLPFDLDPARSTRKRREEFLEELQANPRLLRERVREIRPGPEVTPLPARTAAAVRRLVRRYRAAGIEPLFLLCPPADRDNRDWEGAREAGVLPNLFALDDPRQYPQFYLDLSVRFDLNHLVKEGGNELTRMLADEVAAHLKAQQER